MSTKAITLNSKKSVGALVKDWMSLVGIAILIVVFSIISYVKFGAQYFLTWSNWKNILLQSSTVAIVALGQSIMLLTGNFDLSLGRMVCLTSCVGAILMKNVGMSTGLAILIMFAIGLAVGAVNGLAKLLTQAVPIANMPDSISFLGRGYIFGGVFPVCVLLMIIVYAIAQFVTSKTRVGRNLYAVGGSREAAFFSGINVKAYQFGTFLLGSVLATFGGLVLMSRLNSVAVTNGQNYEFDAVIGSIIGGVSLAGGKGRVIGTMFGCIFLNTLFNGFSQMGVDPFVQDVLKGVVLVLAVTLDVASNKKKS